MEEWNVEAKTEFKMFAKERRLEEWKISGSWDNFFEGVISPDLVHIDSAAMKKGRTCGQTIMQMEGQLRPEDGTFSQKLSKN